MPLRDTTIEAVIFDWGGTLSTFATAVRIEDLWRPAADALLPHTEHDHERIHAALSDAEETFWRRTESDQRAGTLHDILADAAARLVADFEAHHLDAAADAYLEAWEPHIEHDLEAVVVLGALRERGVRTAMLSNTHWPRDFHERFLARDGLAELLDSRLYTSELTHMKPHRAAFDAALAAVGVEDPGRALFVGDRPYDDIHGARSAGLRTALRTNPLVPAYDVQPDLEITALTELLVHVPGPR